MGRGRVGGGFYTVWRSCRHSVKELLPLLACGALSVGEAGTAGVVGFVPAAEEASTVVATTTEPFAASVPLGVWFTESVETVNRNGVQMALKRRTVSLDAGTWRGQLNARLKALKENEPAKTVYLETPDLDASATATNRLGLLAGDYAAVVREAGNVWAVTVVDLAGEAPVSAAAEEKTIGLFRSGTTNRPPASVSVSSAGCGLDSRTVNAMLSACVPFASDEDLGLRLLVR